MKALQEKILREGSVSGNDILKVDSFLNHQIDVAFLNEIGREFKERFKGEKVDKIFTIEASGIAIASIVSQYFDNAPVVFAKNQNLKIWIKMYMKLMYIHLLRQESIQLKFLKST